ncbi:hypothetical protein ACVW1C_007580 [Bradyrhizobium sp. USDA 4011]
MPRIVTAKSVRIRHNIGQVGRIRQSTETLGMRLAISALAAALMLSSPALAQQSPTPQDPMPEDLA